MLNSKILLIIVLILLLSGCKTKVYYYELSTNNQSECMSKCDYYSTIGECIGTPETQFIENPDNSIEGNCHCRARLCK